MANNNPNNTARESANETGEQSRRKTVDRRDPDSTELIRPPKDERRKAPRRRPKTKKSKDKGQDSSGGRSSEDLAKETEQLLVRCRRLLMTCEPVARVNYATLSMDDFPGNELVDQCRKARDFWTIGALSGFFVFFLGVLGLVAGWIAGLGSGICVLCVCFGFTPLRHYISKVPLLSEVLRQRRLLLKDALSHIAYLEGEQNLAFRCAALVEYNPGLNRPAFATIIAASKAGRLLNILRTKKHIRLYLLFMLESQKAFLRLEKFYTQLRSANLEDAATETRQKKANS